MANENAFLQEIAAKAKEIHTDAYPMSIGELMSIYRDGELDIHPEFQRFFRWSPVQKSKFIESILLGLPVPSIFVSQREDGVWDVVDGVQRLSTIFEFTGMLRNNADEAIAPSTLVGTDYLPLLEGKVWEDANDTSRSFPSALRLDFKRQKLDLKIIKKESDENTRYDLFERLNTLGSSLSDQEMRNCLLVMLNPELFHWLQSLTEIEAFQEALALTDKALIERYDMELLLRYIVFSSIPENQLQGLKDVGDFLTRKMRSFATDPGFDKASIRLAFQSTFDSLLEAFGSDCFRRQDGGRGRGGFLISVFEVLGVGLGSRYLARPHHKVDTDQLRAIRDNLWDNQDFRQYSRSGVSASSRVPRLIPLGRQLFEAA